MLTYVLNQAIDLPCNVLNKFTQALIMAPLLQSGLTLSHRLKGISLCMHTAASPFTLLLCFYTFTVLYGYKVKTLTCTRKEMPYTNAALILTHLYKLLTYLTFTLKECERFLFQSIILRQLQSLLILFLTCTLFYQNKRAF